MVPGAANYIFNPKKEPPLEHFDVPLIKAIEVTVKSYGSLVEDPTKFQVEPV